MKNEPYTQHDLFVTELWEFDFPYHKQAVRQVDEIINKYGTDGCSKDPSLETYGGDELWYEDDIELNSFIEIQIKKMFQKISQGRPWAKGHWGKFEQWMNVNIKGNFNPPHIHPNHHYSGCYYVKFPDNSGNVHFLDPRPQHRICAPDIGDEYGHQNPYLLDSKYDSSLFTYPVREGKVIIFPSWLMHYVDPNPKEELRVSIAFNCDWIND